MIIRPGKGPAVLMEPHCHHYTCPTLHRLVCNDLFHCLAPSGPAGVHKAAAAGEVALAGTLAAVEQLHQLAAEQQQHQQQQGHTLSPLGVASGSSAVVRLCNGSHSSAAFEHWQDLPHCSSCAEPTLNQQLQLLQDDLNEQQQQQQLDQLASNGTASTSQAALSSSYAHTLNHGPERFKSTNVDRLGRTSSSNGQSSQLAAERTHVQQQQQGSSGASSCGSSSRSSGSSSSTSSSLSPGLQLVRPSEGSAVAGGECADVTLLMQQDIRGVAPHLLVLRDL